MRRVVCILLAFLIPALSSGVSARRSAAVAASAFPSEDNADGEREPQGNQDPAGAQELMLVALRMPVTLRATAPRSFRLRGPAARAPRPGPVPTAARLCTSATPLRC